LTQRETEVARVLAEGYSIPQAAALLGLKKHTILGTSSSCAYPTWPISFAMQ
jgi:hypothetical protein